MAKVFPIVRAGGRSGAPRITFEAFFRAGQEQALRHGIPYSRANGVNIGTAITGGLLYFPNVNVN
jgi:hypothetical protein